SGMAAILVRIGRRDASRFLRPDVPRRPEGIDARDRWRVGAADAVSSPRIVRHHDLLETRGPLETLQPAPAVKAFPIKTIALPDSHETRGVRAFEMELQGAGMHGHQIRRLFPRDREWILPLRPTRSMATVASRTGRFTGRSPSHHPILPEMTPSPPYGGLD